MSFKGIKHRKTGGDLQMILCGKGRQRSSGVSFNRPLRSVMSEAEAE